MKTYIFNVRFISYSIKDGREFIMGIYEYIPAKNENKAIAYLKKKIKHSEYYAAIGPRIIDIFVHMEEEDPQGFLHSKNIYHNDHPQPSLFDLSGEYKQ